MQNHYDIAIVGGGVFGLSAALSLRRHKFDIVVIDQGQLPHPDAASTDISKIVRMEYGQDEEYMEMVESALPIWREWNKDAHDTLFYESGVAMMTSKVLSPGDFEFESFSLLQKRGHNAERLNQKTIYQRFPAWKSSSLCDGFFHHAGGFAESGKVIEYMAEKARKKGVAFVLNSKVAGFKKKTEKDYELFMSGNKIISASKIVLCCGAWTIQILPELKSIMKVTGHPVFHLDISEIKGFHADQFPVFTANISSTGWYGFPLHPVHEVLKIANHGVGRSIDPTHDPRTILEDQRASLNSFLSEMLPQLKDSPIVYERLCLYCDTLDEHFWIDQHPDHPGVFVATGGSGHGFKFAPVIGDIITDCVLGKPNKYLNKFKWRELGQDTKGEEAARFHG